MTDITFQARYLVVTRRPARAAAVLRLGIDLLQWVPSFRDTRRGRAKARAIRIMALGVGLLVFAIVDTELRLLGVPVAALALVVPMPELRKRTLTNNLRRKLEVEALESTTVDVLWDGKRLDVGREPRLRRVLTKPGSFVVETHDDGVVIRSVSGRKAETIVLAQEPGVDRFGASDADVEKLVHGLREIL